MTQRVLKPFGDLTAAQLEEWQTWLVRHGLPDACDIPYGVPLLCDDDARTVTVQRFVRDENGKGRLDGTNEMLKEDVTVHLESPAMAPPLSCHIQVVQP